MVPRVALIHRRNPARIRGIHIGVLIFWRLVRGTGDGNRVRNIDGHYVADGKLMVVVPAPSVEQRRM
jgi:hypothetical protein